MLKHQRTRDDAKWCGTNLHLIVPFQRGGIPYKELQGTVITFFHFQSHPCDIVLNPFHATGIFLYSRKAPEDLWFSVFMGYRKRPAARNGLTQVMAVFPSYRNQSLDLQSQ